MLIDSNVELCARHKLSEEEFNTAILSLLLSSMRASGAKCHNLADDDGICILSATRYE
ncbi:hypothetical protein HOT14_gp74 [Escherichia phage vB_EcoS_IME347]|uniref:Uncharacterized protein n=1 Tax=Escherichia phage vB_EcoS_IME347 TaxID=2496546 RepID=A0A2S1GSA4_9CAUD|nr:hypothetical protein HOT14_gp74 [Escherichia phage vB_EcoS_IME347]AWD92274.1 hypothetical protein [Escherichia phage vB_EcoS_IME347]